MKPTEWKPFFLTKRWSSSPPEGYTYLAGRPISMLAYYKQQQIPHKLCPRCHQYAPLTAFHKEHGWWVCSFCPKEDR